MFYFCGPKQGVIFKAKSGLKMAAGAANLLAISGLKTNESETHIHYNKD